MRDRMPAAYIRVLKLPFRTTTKGDELHRSVMDLVLSYDFNYGLIFPEINHIPELVQFAKELALPSKQHHLSKLQEVLSSNNRTVDSVIVTRKLASILGYQFHFPTGKSSNPRLDYPEIRLMALLIVATKLYFPLPSDSSASYLQIAGSLEIPTLDWATWRQGKSNLPTQHEKETTKFDFDKVTPSQVVSMADDELDAYFAHVSSLIDSNSELQCKIGRAHV